MSGALSVFSIAASPINALGAMEFGATGGVILGDFAFSGFEVPEFITIGGQQKMTVHSLPGGERIIDLLGHEDHDLEWSGILIDGFPAQRAQMLDQMRLDGPALPLQWGDWYFTVIVRDFRAETRYSQLNYRISCVVAVNPAARPTQPEPDTQQAVSEDLGTAETTAPASVKPSVQKALPLPPSEVDAIVPGVPTNEGMDTATGLTVPAPTETSPTPVGYVDEFGHAQGEGPHPWAAAPPSVAPAAATVGTEGGLVPPATPAEAFTSSPFIN